MNRKMKGVVNKMIVPIAIVAAILVSTVTTLLVNNSSRSSIPDGYLSIEDVQALLSAVTLPAGYMEDEGKEISYEEGEEIERAVADMEQMWVDAPPDGAPQVQTRDWDRYTSQLAKKELTFKEAAFYDRLDEMCQRYLTSSARDGVYYKYDNEEYNCYATAGVSYSDLGLNLEQAKAVQWWFKYNNPQYYFLTGGRLTTTDKIYLIIADFAADGEERVELTNALFDKLDGWVDEVNDGAVTTWQKQLAANNLLCKNIVYHDPFTKGGEGNMGQTLYSAVTLEKTVCAGYAQAFSAIMNASGVETVVALSHNHAWNVSLMDDGNYYAIDTTWNDNKEDDDAPYNDYFNVGDKGSKAGDGDSGTHTYSNTCAAWTPVIAENDYEPTEYDRTGGSGSALQLAAPENLRATSDQDGKLGVQWDPVDQAEAYTVEVYEDVSMRSFQARGSVGGTAASVTYTTPTLAIRVRATASVDGTEYASNWSDFLEVETKARQSEEAPAKLPAPQNVKATDVGSTSAVLAWDTVEEAEKYQVASFRDSGYSEVWATGYTTNSFSTITKLQPDTVYYFGVRAMKTVDGEEVYSDWAFYSVSTPAEAQSAAPAKPAAPTNIQITPTDEADTARITWDAVSGAAGYEVVLYKDASRQDVWNQLTRSTDERFVRLINLDEGESRYLSIRTVASAGGQESYSDWVDFSYTHTYLAAPENVTATATAADTARITWEAVPGATGYEVVLYKDETYQEVWNELTRAADELFVRLINMEENEVRYFSIRSIGEAGGQEIYSNWSDWTYTHSYSG